MNAESPCNRALKFLMCAFRIGLAKLDEMRRSAMLGPTPAKTLRREVVRAIRKLEFESQHGHSKFTGRATTETVLRDES
jgi:hypothetical protein